MSLKRALTTLPPSFRPWVCTHCRRNLSTTSALSSGHSKWATIKHDKGRNDAAKGKERASLSQAITVASRSGSPDPGLNTRLADAIAIAKKAGYPKQGIETAIARGQGKSMNGAPLEDVMIEAVVPPVAMIVEAQTESKGKLMQELRVVLKKAGAQVTPTQYLFERKGRIVLAKKEGVGVDEVLETALEAGALDVVEGEDGSVIVETEPSALKSTEAQLEAAGLELSSSETLWEPNEDSKVGELEEEPLNQLARLQYELEDYPGVQAVYLNADIDQLQASAAAT